jgi:hypothetical protein
LLDSNQTSLSANDILVLFNGNGPAASSNWAGVQFQLPQGYVVQAGQSISFRIGYVIDPPPSIIRGFEVDLLTETPVKPGSAVINGLLCPGGSSIADCPNKLLGLQVFHLGTPVQSGDVKAIDVANFPLTNIVAAQFDFILDGGPAGSGGSADIKGIQTKALTAVPEPEAWAMMAAGLALLFRRQRAL